jgi:hypothetical protein
MSNTQLSDFAFDTAAGSFGQSFGFGGSEIGELGVGHFEETAIARVEFGRLVFCDGGCGLLGIGDRGHGERNLDAIIHLKCESEQLQIEVKNHTGIHALGEFGGMHPGYGEYRARCE